MRRLTRPKMKSLLYPDSSPRVPALEEQAGGVENRDPALRPGGDRGTSHHLEIQNKDSANLWNGYKEAMKVLISPMMPTWVNLFEVQTSTLYKTFPLGLPLSCPVLNLFSSDRGERRPDSPT